MTPYQHDHTYNQKVVDAKYLKSAATCTDAAVYYMSCICGEASTTETFTSGDPLGHTYGVPTYEWKDDKCTATHVCTVCTEETAGHTETETVTGNYVKDTDATCTTAESGHYEAALLESAKNCPKNETHVHIGAIASGSTVVANKSIIDMQVKKQAFDTKGLEMEAYGVVYASNHAIDPKPYPIVAKSVCDFADSRKSDVFQKFAAYTSCEFVKLLVDEILN